jgi:hypothetical protein
MPVDRTHYNTLVDDDGSGTTGSVFDKADVDGILDAVDGAIAGLTSNGTTITQIAFPAAQSASTNANTLDDYEEGAWTPVIGGSGGTSGQTYSKQVARYVKVGKKVSVQGYVLLTAKGTITGNVQLQGLPFAAENTTDLYSAAAMWGQNTSGLSGLSGFIQPNTSVIAIYGSGVAAADHGALATANITNTTGFIFSATYRADS